MKRLRNYYDGVINLLRGVVFIYTHTVNKKNPIRTTVKLIRWKTAKLFTDKSFIVNLGKVRCICPTQSSYGGMIYLTKYPEYWETIVVKNILKKGSAMIDVGSNIGYYTILGAGEMQGGKVYAFDVDTRPIKAFLENIRFNNLQDKVVFTQVLVSDKNGFEYFKKEKQSEMSHIVVNGKSKGAKRRKSVKLDTFAKENELEKIRLIKIDVEGAEFKVISGMKNLLKNKKVDYLMTEINKEIYNFGNKPKELYKLLQQSGYNLFVVDNGLRELRKSDSEEFVIKKTILAVSPTVDKKQIQALKGI